MERLRSYFLVARMVMLILLLVVLLNSAAKPASSLEPAEVEMTIKSFPIMALISFSIFRAVFSVSSIRVPRCSSAVTLMRPLS